MPSFAVMPNYRKVQPNNLVVGAAETDLPVVDTNKLSRPSKVFVQALSTNTESVFIGPAGVLADGTGAVYELPQGSSLFLPNHVIEEWKVICASGGQNLLVTYFEGVC